MYWILCLWSVLLSRSYSLLSERTGTRNSTICKKLSVSCSRVLSLNSRWQKVDKARMSLEFAPKSLHRRPRFHSALHDKFRVNRSVFLPFFFQSAQDGDPWPPCGAAVIRQGARRNQERADPEPRRAAEGDGPALQQSDEHAAPTWQSPVSTKAAFNPQLPVASHQSLLWSLNRCLSSRPEGWSGSSSWSIIGSCRTHLTSCKLRPSLRLIRPNNSCRTGSRRSMTWKLSSRSVKLQAHL